MPWWWWRRKMMNDEWWMMNDDCWIIDTWACNCKSWEVGDESSFLQLAFLWACWAIRIASREVSLAWVALVVSSGFSNKRSSKITLWEGKCQHRKSLAKFAQLELLIPIINICLAYRYTVHTNHRSYCIYSCSRQEKWGVAGLVGFTC